MLDKIRDGRTDLVFEYTGSENVLKYCAYYGDVSAIRYLLAKGASLTELGGDLGLNAASFHGHWRLVQFLVEQGADVNRADPDTGETPLHAALCTANRVEHNNVMRVLLAAGANPNAATKPGAETGGFMRDVRTRGETPLHRAAAFGDEEAIQLLLDAGADKAAKDAHGDSPLSWASWHLRATPVLRMLLYGNFRIRPEYAGMKSHLSGKPHA